MTRPAAQAYVDTRNTDPELEEIIGRIEDAEEPGHAPVEHEEHDEEGEAGEGHKHAGPGKVDLHGPSNPLEQMGVSLRDPTRYVPNAVAAVYDSAKEFGAFMLEGVDALAEGGQEVREKLTGEEEAPLPSSRQKWNKASEDNLLVNTMETLREGLRKESTAGDIMVQKTLQFGLPFYKIQQALGVARSVSKLAKGAKLVLADILTNATVWDPFEGRFGEFLQEVTPENSSALMARYTDVLLHSMPSQYGFAPGLAQPVLEKGAELVGGAIQEFSEFVSPEEGDTVWDGRFKNAVDSFVLNSGMSAVAGLLAKAIMPMLKTGHQISHLGDPAKIQKAVDLWVAEGRGTPTQTVEIFSAASPQGQHINAARDLASGVRGEADVLERDLLEAQVEGMKAVRESGGLRKLAHAITGRHTELAGVQSPSATRPFDFSGTYEGGLTPNLRVPMVGMTDAEIARMNAEIGHAWDQDAMVASEVRNTTWEAAVPEGFTRGATLIVTEAPDAAALALRVRAALPKEHEFAIHALDEGSFAVDIFPAFTDSGQVGIGKDTALRLVDELGEGADAVAHDYRSVYTTRDEYQGLIGESHGQAADAGRSGGEVSGAERPLGDDLLAEARADLAAAREAYEGRAGQAVERLEFRIAEAEGGTPLSGYPQSEARTAALSELDSMSPPSGMNSRERAAYDAAAAWIHASPERAMRQYRQLPSTDNGRILGTDDAKELDPAYRADRTLSDAVSEPYSKLVRAMYVLALEKPPKKGQDAMVLMTAGGTGSGKTTSLQGAAARLQKRAQIVFDSNLKNPETAKLRIDQALTAGKKVIISYVGRDILDAWRGAITRAGEMERRLGSGRPIKIESHLDTHFESFESMLELGEHYKDNPAVKFVYIRNDFGSGARRVSPDNIAQLDRKAYNDLHEQALTILEEARKNGEISDRLAAAFANTPAPERGRGNRPDTGRGTEPGSAGQEAPLRDPDPHAGHSAGKERAEESLRMIDEDEAYEGLATSPPSVQADAAFSELQQAVATLPTDNQDEFLRILGAKIQSALRGPGRSARFGKTLREEVDEIRGHRDEYHPDDMEGMAAPHKPNWHGHKGKKRGIGKRGDKNGPPKKGSD